MNRAARTALAVILLLGPTLNREPLHAQDQNGTATATPAAAVRQPNRFHLYAAGVAGQILGVGSGWLLGRIIGVHSCPNYPGSPLMCEEGFVPTKAEAARFGAIAGGIILPPIVVRLRNPGKGQILKDYFYMAITMGITARLAAKHSGIYYTLPVVQLATVVESELESAHRTRVQTAAGDSTQDRCTGYAPEVVTLTGKLQRKTFPGAPNFESVKRGDEPETGFYLTLKKPGVCVARNTDTANEAVTGVRSVQLILNENGYNSLRPLLGQTVAIRGTLSHAFSGHHHATLLLTVH